MPRSSRFPAPSALVALAVLVSPAAAQTRTAEASAFLCALDPLRVDVTNGNGDFLDHAYGLAFGRLGLDVETATDEEILGTLAEHGVSQQAGLALDGWARACVLRGSKHYKRSNRRVALALAADPHETRAILRRAFLEKPLMEMGKVALALGDRELDPATAAYVAESLDYAEDPEGCRAILAAAVTRHPDDFQLRLVAAHHMAATERLEEAWGHLDRAAELDPGSPWPLAERSRLQRWATEYEAGKEAGLAAVAKDPDFYPAYQVLTQIGRLMPDDELTILGYRELARLFPGDAGTLNSFAWSMAIATDESLREPQKAVAYAQRALELDPENDAILNTLGTCQYRAGQYDACIATIERSMQASPETKPTDFFVLALAWHALEDDDFALECYEKGVARLAHEDTPTADDEYFKAEAQKALGIEDSHRHEWTPVEN